MAWSNSDTGWILESYDTSTATYTTSKGREFEMLDWKNEDKVEVMRGLTETFARTLANTINSQPQTWDHKVHALAERVGDSGQYCVRRTTHDVVYVGVTPISGNSSGA